MTTTLPILVVLSAVGTVIIFCISGYQLTRYRQWRARLNARLGGLSTAEEEGRSQPSVLLRISGVLDQTNVGKRLTKQLKLADLKLTPVEWISLEILLVLFLFVALRFFFFGASFWSLSLLAGAGAYLTTKAFLNSRRDHYLKAFDAQMSAVTLLMSNSLKANLNVQQAFKEVAEKMDRPAGVEFGDLSNKLRLGLELDEAMRRMVVDFPSKELRLMLTTIMIQRLAGGNLAQALSVMSGAMMERFKIKDEVRTMTAEVRYSALVLFVLPVVVFAILNRMLEGAVGRFLGNPIGFTIFVIFIGIMALAFFLINKFGKIEV